jgi:hypothetical protein
MNDGQPTQPLTDAELAAIRGRAASADDPGMKWSYGAFADSAADVPDLLAEVDRLRAENTAQAAQVEVARSELSRCMGRLEPYARQLKASGNTEAGVPIGVAVGVLRLAQERIEEAEPASLDQSGEGQANA